MRKKQKNGVRAPPKKETALEKNSQRQPAANMGSLSAIGSDEVGTGDFFGPITVVAAYVKKRTFLF